VASATRERLLKQIFGTLNAQDRATMIRLLGALDAAASTLITCARPVAQAISQ
jgi:hypothetical protein